MKPLTIGISYNMKIIFLVFCYQNYLPFFHLFLGHIGPKTNKA